TLIMLLASATFPSNRQRMLDRKRAASWAIFPALRRWMPSSHRIVTTVVFIDCAPVLHDSSACLEKLQRRRKSLTPTFLRNSADLLRPDPAVIHGAAKAPKLMTAVRPMELDR